MATKRKNIVWKVEGSNWSWTGPYPASTPPEEVATRVVETLAKPDAWDESFREGLVVSGGENPKVGMIMMISNSGMKSESEHLIVLSSTIMANAGLHDKARVLDEASG